MLSGFFVTQWSPLKVNTYLNVKIKTNKERSGIEMEENKDYSKELELVICVET